MLSGLLLGLTAIDKGEVVRPGPLIVVTSILRVMSYR